MDGILNFILGGLTVCPEVVVIIKFALIFYAYNLIVDILDMCKRGGRM